MTDFFSVRHNTTINSGMPEIQEIVEGLVNQGRCSSCGVLKRYPFGDLRVRLGKQIARFWPDVIACGDYPLFVVSDRFVSAFQTCGLSLFVGGSIRFIEPIDLGLPIGKVPHYEWIDGSRHRAGTMDFESSGFVNVRFCASCGNRTDDIGATYDRQHAKLCPYTFNYDESKNLDLFVTDLSTTAYFCTSRVLECARRNKLTNLRFVPAAQGVLGKPVKYS